MLLLLLLLVVASVIVLIVAVAVCVYIYIYFYIQQAYCFACFSVSLTVFLHNQSVELDLKQYESVKGLRLQHEIV